LARLPQLPQVLLLFWLQILILTEKELGGLGRREGQKEMGWKVLRRFPGWHRTTLARRDARWFQSLQIAIHRTPRPSVAFCLEFSFQLRSIGTTLVPARKHVGFVRIKQARPLFSGTRVRDVSRSHPPLNGSRCHTELLGYLRTFHPLFVQFQDVFVTSLSLGLTGLLRLYNSPRLAWTPGVRWLFLCLLRPDCCYFGLTKLSETGVLAST
jgi:hypothetical protein